MSQVLSCGACGYEKEWCGNGTMPHRGCPRCGGECNNHVVPLDSPKHQPRSDGTCGVCFQQVAA